ncbi:hypothetical protein HNR46_002902 [Haloferula luteola]|uniref:Uncharacterized protein n=1 Tax=Haloferula luteola TaxID=595692 RepID=A0A840VAS7_9BACT|nr:DUF6600 domain-containing protein [Haloferula luteola]MBB5352654.1 hypothetical protein [Haloferula luteola]
MKTLISLSLAGAFLLTACDRSPSSSVEREDAEAVLTALDEARQAAESEREALEAERQRLEAERDALADARSLQEEELSEIDPVESVPVAVAVDENDPAAQRDMLEAWEADLTEREKDLAGSQALEDELEIVPETYQEPVADYGLFYDSLQDQGEWFDTPDYGYIFQPRVVVQDRQWRPYTHGRWVCSDRGWLWVSDESFGWATYHYGRWVLLAGRGWCWVPGGEWAPAWVAWRHGGGHVGWAPLPPETMVGSPTPWGVNVEVDFGIAEVCFIFVEERYMAAPIWRHCVPFPQYRRFWAQARPCTNFYYVHGRPMACGPNYANLRRRVATPWPVRRIDLDPIGGLRAPGMRAPRQVDRSIRVFAPSLNAAWNPAIRPPKLGKPMKTIQVERAAGGVNREWMGRYQQQRKQRDEARNRWAGQVNDVRQQQLKKNRLAVVDAREQWIQKKLAKPLPQPAVRPGSRDVRPSVPNVKEEPRRGQDDARRQSQEAKRLQQERKKTEQAALKQQQERVREQQQQRQKEAARLQAEEKTRQQERKKAEQSMKQQQEESRRQQQQESQQKLQRQKQERADQAKEQRQQQERARQEQQRQQQERARQEKEQRQQQERARQEQQQRQQQERARQEQQQRQQQERARQEQQRQQQERARQEKEQRQQQERARQEQQRQQQERARQEQQRQQQERARQEQQQRQQQERARQEQQQRQQQERARQEQQQRQQQERARQEQQQRQQQERARQEQQQRQQQERRNR